MTADNHEVKIELTPGPRSVMKLNPVRRVEDIRSGLHIHFGVDYLGRFFMEYLFIKGLPYKNSSDIPDGYRDFPKQWCVNIEGQPPGSEFTLDNIVTRSRKTSIYVGSIGVGYQYRGYRFLVPFSSKVLSYLLSLSERDFRIVCITLKYGYPRDIEESLYKMFSDESDNYIAYQREMKDIHALMDEEGIWS